MWRTLALLSIMILSLFSSACAIEDDIDDEVELADSSDSGDADVDRTVYGPFTNLTIYPPPDTVIAGGLCPWFWDICDITCPSCNALTADHGHTCVSCPQGAGDCNCAVGVGPWTDPRTSITYTNKWYPKIKN